MLVRSISAPVTQSHFLDSPHRNTYVFPNTQLEHSHTNISFSHSVKHLVGSLVNPTSSAYQSSVPQFSPRKIHGKTLIRRALSDGNLEGLDFNHTPLDLGGSLDKGDNSMLRTEPSFCIYNDEEVKIDEGIQNEDLINESLISDKLERSVSIAENLEEQFSFGRNEMQVIKEDDEVEGDEDNGDVDMYYDRLIRENPSNPLVLRNYAQYLESKSDFSGAEEYYFRATVADPKDGEILSRYAKLVWQLHRDHDKASFYFERAAKVAPEDSHVLAAYASFLWEIDEDEEEDNLFNSQVEKASLFFEKEKRPASPPLHLAMGLGVNVMGFDRGNDATSNESSTIEEYYRKMAEENPCDPVSLKNYAHFLHQTKGDLHRAEDYYSRAILSDPCDGQLLSLYANLVWELYRDKQRATSYFERAVQANPVDSVLGSYAKFLWETEDDENEDVRDEVDNQMSIS